MGGMEREFDGGYAEYTCVPASQVQRIKTELPCLHVQIGETFHMDQIVEAHRLTEENRAGGKIVVLT